MPRKIRELMKELKMAGLVDRGGKGSHRNYAHLSGVVLTISGRPGDDAKLYQVKLVRQKIEETRHETEG
jgi:predicted RNA binding protein YcfA (HicA-like mRNA interferase family)